MLILTPTYTRGRAVKPFFYQVQTRPRSPLLQTSRLPHPSPRRREVPGACRDDEAMSLLMVALSCSSSSPRSVFKLLAPHDVDVHTFEGTGRGLRTLRDRELGEALLEVPDSGVVLAERVLETDSRLAAAAAHAAELGTPLSDEGLLACFVAQAMSGEAAADVRMLRLMHDVRCALRHAPCTVCCAGGS